MFALIDCNNFYASCERLFRPDLTQKPVIVLSNNDGCVIARSNEAKALGIIMGAPYFKIKGVCQQHHVSVFSSNYALYGDLSYRVMQTIKGYWPQVEVYSIDEAFLDLSTLPMVLHEAFSVDLQRLILKNIGIPTSVGIGKTKTLAKIASHIAKKVVKTPVFILDKPEQWLDKIDMGDVWGIGRQWQQKLAKRGMLTAGDLARANPTVIRQAFNVMLMRTGMELAGQSCMGLSVPTPKQSIVSSRSFGCLQIEYGPLAEAVSQHCRTAWEKMRHDQLTTQRLSVFVQSNRFRDDLPQYNNTIDVKLIRSTDDLCYITHCATEGLKSIFKSGIHYQKVGVQLSQFSDNHSGQLDLFDQPSEESVQKTERAMDVIQCINQKFGRHTLYLAAEGTHQTTLMKSGMKSPNYTTQWSDLPVISCLASL